MCLKCNQALKTDLQELLICLIIPSSKTAQCERNEASAETCYEYCYLTSDISLNYKINSLLTHNEVSHVVQVSGLLDSVKKTVDTTFKTI
jgi:hypothetical protein